MKPDRLLTLFRRLDKDKSGRLSLKEIGGLAKRFKMSAKDLMKRIDQSKDGYIGFAEFSRFMRKRYSAPL